MSIIKIRQAFENAINTMAPLVASVNILSWDTNGVFTSDTSHNLNTGVLVTISGSTIDGTYFFVRIGDTTFSLQHAATKVAIATPAGGAGGVLTANLTAWEGKNFLPVQGVPYQKVNLLRSPPQNPTYGGNHSREVGFLQVTLLYPKGVGTPAIETRAELLQSTFKRGSTIVKDSIVVNILKKPNVLPSTISGQEISVIVKIPYWCDVFE